MVKEKYSKLRENKEIARWYETIRRGSKNTSEVYLRRLGGFCDVMKSDPFYILKLSDKKLKNLLNDYVTMATKEGKAGSYIASTITSVKSWLSFNEIKIGKIKIENAEDTPTLNNVRLFSQDELKEVLDSCDIRQKVAVSMVAMSGIRLQSLGNEWATDGIMLKDIEGLTVDRNGVKFEMIPAKVTIRKTISKKRHEYFTFIGKEGCGYIEKYLTERLMEGEILTKDSALLTYSKLGLRSGNGFITRNKVSELIRKAIRTAGFENRPYDLRPYFASRLLRAEDDRLITRDYRSFFMGHKGDIEHTYTTQRHLSQDSVEAMKEAYARSFKYLQSRPAITPEEKETLEKGLAETLFTKYLNFSEQETLELLDLPDEERRKLIEQKIGKPQDKDNIRLKAESDKKEIENRNSGSRQKVIQIDYVETYMDLGFEFVSQLGSDRAIMRLP